MHPSISGLLHHLSLAHLASGRPRDDRGDVPGWVMVTLMTAIVVAALTPFVPQRPQPPRAVRRRATARQQNQHPLGVHLSVLSRVGRDGIPKVGPVCGS